MNLIPLHHQIEAAALSYPDKVAVIDDDGNSMSYFQLVQRAKQLSAHLCNQGVVEGNVVSLVVNSNNNLIIGILGILGAGGVLLPISVSQPKEMVRFMFTNSDAQFIVTDRKLDYEIGENYTLIEMESFNLDLTKDFIFKSFPFSHIIYTSGSTGKPKGVKISHAALENLCNWYTNFVALNELSRVLIMIPFTSDAVYKNIFSTLCVGGTLVMANTTNYHPLSILKKIEKEAVTHVNCVPSAIYQVIYLAERSHFKGLRSLKALILGGASINRVLLKEWFRNSHLFCQLFNIYGPTECTDIAIATKIKLSQLSGTAPIPLGVPISQMNAIIVDEEGTPQPSNTMGELVISGIGVCDGYLNNEELTSKHFSTHIETQERVYHTGDLCSYDALNGFIFHGRIDRQIKIKGIRVEPKEVELYLTEIEGVVQAAVVPIQTKNGSINLHGFVVIERGIVFDTTTLLHSLALKLPKHSIPQSISQINQIPLLSNGKLDESQLKHHLS